MMPPGPTYQPPMMGGVPVLVDTPRPMSRIGHVLLAVGGILMAVGVIIMAFALGSITISNINTGYGGGYGPASVSFSVSMGGFTAGLILLGVGLLLRSLGALFAHWK